jgi:hypothetical protein
MFVAGAVWVENDAPACLRLAAIKDFFAAPLPRRQCRAGRDDQTDGWPSYAGAADVRHEAHVVGVMAAHVVLPWIHRAFSNAKTWASASTTGCDDNTFTATSTNWSSDSVAAAEIRNSIPSGATS